jgi:hypothetical protein
MDRHPYELPIPGPAPGDARAYELVRVWESGETQHVALNALLWDDPGIWGIALVDLAKLIADAYGESSQMNSATALDRIKWGFDAEWNFATDTPKGGLIGSL